jgi:xanthine/uracil permease
MSLQNDLALVVQSALFVSAINTMLQTNLGSRLPAVMGNSFYFLSITLSIVNAPSIVDIPDPHEVSDITQNLLEVLDATSKVSTLVVLVIKQIFPSFCRDFGKQ